MKHHPALRISFLLAVAMLVASAFCARAQTAPPSAPPPGTLLDETDLEQLVAPVALYPDPLLAEVLPAATYPSEIESAAAWMAANPSPTEQLIDAQPYDPPVQALLHYPTVLQMLSDQIDWTQQLGVAFLNQPTDVMNAVQQLRQRALSGTASWSAARRHRCTAMPTASRSFPPIPMWCTCRNTIPIAYMSATAGRRCM